MTQPISLDDLSAGVDSRPDVVNHRKLVVLRARRKSSENTDSIPTVRMRVIR